MKRKSIAIAVAGVLALPLSISTASALEVYGKAHGSIDFSSNDDEGANQEDSTLAFSNNASRIGFKGDEQINDDLTVTYQAETVIDMDSGGWGGGRNTYIGLKGGFGEVRGGLHDTPYKSSTYDMFSDTRGDYNAIIGSINGSVDFDERTPNTILYISPDMSGFQFQGAYILGIAAADDDLPDAEEPDNTGFSLAGMYNQGPLSLSLAMETYGIEAATGEPTDDAQAVKFGAGWDLGQGTKLSFIFESAESGTTDVSRDAFYFGVMHKMSDKTTLKLALGQADELDVAEETGATYLALGVSQKLSKDTELYALFASVSNDDGATYRLDGVGLPTTGTPSAPVPGRDTSSLSFGIVKNFSGKFM
ncbi:MAG: porin [Gammaproteobacteria bacterium]|nr:porin [Gammaproteobacteria bacterium]